MCCCRLQDNAPMPPEDDRGQNVVEVGERQESSGQREPPAFAQAW